MRKFHGAIALMMAFCLISVSVFAQDERPARGGRGGGGGGPGGGGGGPGGGGFGGGFGRGMGMGMQGGASQLLGLLRMEEVRKEVKVSNESYEAVQTAQREAMSGFNFREASEEERTKMMKEQNVKAQEFLDELVDPAGMKRLMGLLLQQQGQSAATNDLIAKEIGLKDPELKAVTEAVAKVNEERGTKMRELFTGGGGFGGGGGGGPDPEMQKKMTELMADLRKKSDAAIDEKLTADQKKAIETLKGEKFTFPEFGDLGVAVALAVAVVAARVAVVVLAQVVITKVVNRF
jgi:hypothetical protein